MRTLALVVAVAACGLPRLAAAEPVLALRLGLAPAVGSAAADVPMGDVVPLQVPVQLDALWRLPGTPVAAGLYGSWGWARAGRCGSEASCSASVTRLGLQATWSFAAQPGEPEPWLGASAGYEWARQARSREGTVTTSYRGLEPIAVQGGIEWQVARWLAVGPYGIVGVGRYARVSLETPISSADGEIPSKALHGWIHLGVRGRLDLWGGR